LFVLPEDLPIELTPFAFLVGNWQGTGVISFGETETEFLGQAMSQMPGLVLFQEAE